MGIGRENVLVGVDVRRAMVLVVMVLLGGGVLSATARAAGCPNEQLRVQEVYASGLPDCRAYEQVSPVDKNHTDAVGNAGFVQSAASGEGVTFLSLTPFPGVSGSSSFVTYVSTRGDEGWSTRGLLPATVAGENVAGGVSVSEDLSRTFVTVLNEALGQFNTDVVESATGSAQLLAPGEAKFVDATPGDSRILFENSEALLKGAEAGVPNLYEWNDGRLSLIGVASGGETGTPVGGVVAGPGGPAVGSNQPGGAGSGFYTQNTISEDGSRIFFTEVGKGDIYMREPAAERTVQVSAGVEPAYWRAATPSGSFVFYTEGEDLYRYNVRENVREELTSGTVGVLGTLGVANDGSYVYFVAEGVLPGTSGAAKEEHEANLYEWHEGAGFKFIGKLSTANDSSDWTDARTNNGPAEGFKSSRVTAGGEVVMFSSVEKLTSYDNEPENHDCEGTEKCDELYLYSADSSGVVCVSCNPEIGVEPSSNVKLSTRPTFLGIPERNLFLQRNLSADGGRVFFDTREALVPGDTNGMLDVYEWEAGGEGTCASSSEAFSASSDGCLYLISTGLSSEESYFGDASADGEDAFFFTRQQLVGQDRDENIDVYDARVDGGLAAQNPPLPPPPCAGEACLGAPSSAVFGTPSSALVSGSGNLASPVPAATSTSEKKTAFQVKAERLAKALKACRPKPRAKRKSCEAQARKRYGSAHKAKKSNRKVG
jgi:hypothetical protein